MKNIKIAFTGILSMIFLFSGIHLFSQDAGCKVTLPSISGTYSGQCKKGLANGKGIAQGIDRYEGQFSNGMPDGKGTYTWASGITYKGQFENGLMEGKGEMIYSTQKGDSIVSDMEER